MSGRVNPILSAVEARVLAVLVEKERTVPDTYPMTLNALTAGCNQKTSRDPVMNLTDAQVQAAIDVLRRADLVFESSGSRVMRYSQNVKRVLELPSEKVALLATLMLRGPQTAAELRLNCERLHRFSDQSSVEGYLDDLAGRAAGALVVLLARQPGARESRWTHCLCGPVQGAAGPDDTHDDELPTAGVRYAALQHERADADDRLRQLTLRVERLEADLAALRQALGGPDAPN